MRKKIDFLNKLFSVMQCRTEILDFVVQQKFLSESEKRDILLSDPATHASTIANLLNRLASEEKLQLVTYDWTILPKEHMKLSIVGETDNKEITYSL